MKGGKGRKKRTKRKIKKRRKHAEVIICDVNPSSVTVGTESLRNISQKTEQTGVNVIVVFVVRQKKKQESERKKKKDDGKSVEKHSRQQVQTFTESHRFINSKRSASTTEKKAINNQTKNPSIP